MKYINYACYNVLLIKILLHKKLSNINLIIVGERSTKIDPYLQCAMPSRIFFSPVMILENPKSPAMDSENVFKNGGGFGKSNLLSDRLPLKP